MRRSSSSAARLARALMSASFVLSTAPPPSLASRSPTLPSSEIRSCAVVVAAILAEVGEADHGELEPLGPVHGHHAGRRGCSRLERRLSLPRLDHVALGDGVDEPAQVAALVGLVLARHPHQLAHVRHPARAAGQREQVAVVAGERDGAVDERLQRHLADHAALGREPLGEGARASAGPPPGALRADSRPARAPPATGPGASGARGCRSTPRRRARGRRAGRRAREKRASPSSGLASAASQWRRSATCCWPQ